MGISYAMSVYDIESLTKLLAIGLANRCILRQIFVPG